MLRLEPHQYHHIGTVQERGEARLHRHGVDVLDPGRELLISRRSPPMFLAMSARSGIVVTTRIFASAPV